MTDAIVLPVAGTLALETGFQLGFDPNSPTFLTKIEGWFGSAPIRRSKSDRLGAHGSFAERGWKDERLISISGHSVQPDRAAAAALTDQLSAVFGDGTEGRLQVNDVDLGVRWVDVYLADTGANVTWTGGRDVGFSLHLLAPDSRKYGTSVFSPPVGIPVAGGGLFTEPLFGSRDGTADGVLDFGDPGESGIATATNTGTAETGPVFYISGAYVPGFTITHVATGRQLVYSDTIRSGQTLVLDSNNGTAVLDGYAPRESKLLVANWTQLDAGEVGQWLFESAGSSDATMEVEVVPAWW